MRTCRRTDSGFTLLELMFSLVIIGILLGLGIGFFDPGSSGMRQLGREVAARFSRARVEAMLSRSKVTLEFDGDRIYQIADNGEKKLVQTLPPGIQIAIDGKALMTGGKARCFFSPLGYGSEKLVHLHDGKEGFSIYVPSIGAPVARQGLRSVEDLRHEES